MASGLLNHNQRRHVATYLQLLLEDLRELEASPDRPRDRAENDAVSSALRDIVAAVRCIGDALDLPLERRRDFRRRVSAIANVWAMRTYEIEAKALAAYGVVDPEVGSILSPLVAELRERLHSLAAAANRPLDG